MKSHLLILSFALSSCGPTSEEVSQRRGSGSVPQPDGVFELTAAKAPTMPANIRTVIVAKDGSGKYQSISAALAASQPGDTIQVKNGIYVESLFFKISGTELKPIALINYPGHSPIIDAGGGSYPTSYKRITVNSSWILISGFEIRYGWDGIKVYTSNNTIRGNHIHHNKYQGILAPSVNDLLIEGNTIENNGVEAGTCTSSNWGGFSPKHCHAIYLSEGKCKGLRNVTIRGNIFRFQAGRGILWNQLTNGCSTPESGFYNHIVENNVFENLSSALGLNGRVFGSVFRNNTFVATSYPSTNDTGHYFIKVATSTGNVFKNNIFYTTLGDMRAVEFRSSNADQNTFDSNIWRLVGGGWMWKGTMKSDFKTQYKSVTSWDAKGQCCDVDPKLTRLSNGDFSIGSTSPARNKGTNAECPLADKRGIARPQESICDIGSFEYKP